jgi:hypothetical protein
MYHPHPYPLPPYRLSQQNLPNLPIASLTKSAKDLSHQVPRDCQWLVINDTGNANTEIQYFTNHLSFDAHVFQLGIKTRYIPEKVFRVIGDVEACVVTKDGTFFRGQGCLYNFIRDLYLNQKTANGNVWYWFCFANLKSWVEYIWIAGTCKHGGVGAAVVAIAIIV